MDSAVHVHTGYAQEQEQIISGDQPCRRLRQGK